MDRRAELISALRAASTPSTNAPAPLAPVPVPVPVGLPATCSTQATEFAGRSTESVQSGATPPDASSLARPATSADLVHGQAPQLGQARLLAETSNGKSRSGIQLTLLIAGISLVTIAAIFFVAYAWIFGGAEARAAIVATLTGIAFVAATILQRYKLNATAEGISALAVVLSYVSIWSLQSANFVGLAELDSATLWGSSMLALALVFMAWSQASGMRAPSLAAAATTPFAAALLVWGLTPNLDGAVRLWTASITSLTVGLMYALTPFVERASRSHPTLRPERIILHVASGLSAAVALSASCFALVEIPLAPMWLCGVLVLVLGVHASTSSAPTLGPTAWASQWAPFLMGTATSAAPLLYLLRLDATSGTLVLWPIVLAAFVPLLFEALHASTQNRSTPSRALWVAIGGSIPAGLGVCAALVAAAGAYTDRRGSLGGPSILTANELDLFAASALQLDATFVLFGIAIITGLLWGGFKIARQRLLVLTGLGVVVAMALIALVPAQSLAVLLYALVASIALRFGVASPTQRARILGSEKSAPLVLTTFVVNTLAAYILSFSNTWTWLSVSLAVLVFLFQSRTINVGASQAVLRKVMLTATVTFMLASVVLATAVFQPTAAIPHDAVPFLLLACGVTLLLFSLPLGTLVTAAERVWGLAPSALALVLIVLLGYNGTSLLPLDARIAATSGMLATLGAIGLLSAARHNAMLRITRIAALLSVTIVLWVAASWVLTLVDALLNGVRSGNLAAAAEEFGPAVAGVIVLALSLAHTHSPRSQTNEARSKNDRLFLDLGAMALLAATAVQAIANRGDAVVWVTLLLCAAGALIAAVDDQGLFNGRTGRHALGWVSLALGTAALWIALNTAGTTVTEYYTVPLSVALLLIAILLARSGAATEGLNGIESDTSPKQNVAQRLSIPALVGASLLVGLIPSAFAGAEGALIRPLLVVAAGGIVVLTGCIWYDADAALGSRLRPVRVTLISLGTVGMLLAAWIRAVSAADLTSSGSYSPLFDLWIFVPCLVLLAGAVALAADSRAGSSWLVGIALASATCAQLVLLTASTRGVYVDDDSLVLRVVVLISALSAIAVMLRWRPLPALQPWVSTLALVLAGITALLAIATHPVLFTSVYPFELVTGPLAAALIVAGAIRLHRLPQTSSWRCLAAGLALLFVPGLIANYAGTELWRAVALGVAALLTLGIGLRKQLQAPFVVGAVVVVVHGLAQIWPWVEGLYAAGFWWLWLGAGGILLIVMAASYEQRLKDLKGATRFIRAMR